MLAITLTQPWATLVISGAKRVETRSWPAHYTGPLAIHAAKGWTADDRALCHEPPFLDRLVDAGCTGIESIPRAVMLGVVDLVRCTQMTEASVRALAERSPEEHAFGLYEPGRWAWVLANPRALPEPVEVRGYQKLWRPPAEVVRELETLLPEAA